MNIKQQIEDFAFNNELDVRFIQPYHIRLMKDNFTSVDIFPNSLRMFFLHSRTWVSNENIEQCFVRLTSHFKTNG